MSSKIPRVIEEGGIGCKRSDNSSCFAKIKPHRASTLVPPRARLDVFGVKQRRLIYVIRRAEFLVTHNMPKIVHDIINIAHEAAGHEAQVDTFSGKNCPKEIVVSCCVRIDSDRGLIKQTISEPQVVLRNLSQDMSVKHP